MTFDDQPDLLHLGKRAAKEADLRNREFEIISIDCTEERNGQQNNIKFNLNSIECLFNKLL